VTLVLVWIPGKEWCKKIIGRPLASARGIEWNRFCNFGDCINILQVSKVKVVDTPIVDTRLMLN
jgi:hypothetical protein